MASGSSTSSSGIGLVGMVFIVFLVLKLGVGSTAVMGWLWWWVTAPLWGAPIAFLVIAGTIFGVIYCGCFAEDLWRKWRS